MADRIPEIVDAEQHNLKENRKALGATSKLVDDVDSLYDHLTRGIHAEAVSADAYPAFMTVMHLGAFCRRQVTMGAMTLFRGHEADSMGHLRAAIDGCASAWRISNHPELAALWIDAASDEKAYQSYKKQFKAALLFPTTQNADHHPELTALYKKYDLSSKNMHASIYRLAGSVSVANNGNTVSVELRFFDLAPDHSVITALFLILDSHKQIITVLADAFRKCGASLSPDWTKVRTSIEERIDRHRDRWMPVVVRSISEQTSRESASGKES